MGHGLKLKPASVLDSHDEDGEKVWSGVQR